jgi:hypothetical protein
MAAPGDAGTDAIIKAALAEEEKAKALKKHAKHQDGELCPPLHCPRAPSPSEVACNALGLPPARSASPAPDQEGQDSGADRG